MNQVSPIEVQESEISLVDIVNFLANSWKKLAIAGVIGACFGLGGWFTLGSYSVEYILLNNNSNSNSNSGSSGNSINSYALDIISWKMLQKNLPNLAAQVIDENKVPQNQGRIYKSLADDQWWQKNVTPGFAISKADAKDLASVSKDLDAASTTIINLTLTAKESSKEGAVQEVKAAAQFLRSGGAYLQIRSLLNGYESQTLSTVADLQQKITSTQIEMGYQIERAKSLEELHKRFPGGGSISGQVVDPKDSGAKYLPISTQIIAANNDINASKESLARLQKRLAQIALAKSFLEQALPLQDQTFDGLALDKELLAIGSQLRARLAKDDSNGQEFLDQLHAQLLAIQVRFTKGLEANTVPITSKKGMIKTMTGGLAAGFCLMLFVLLGQRVWQTAKSGGTAK